jgi:PleD family two-component response regulator
MVSGRAMNQEAPRSLRPVVLVVDDDTGLRDSFRLILEDEYDVLDAVDGGEALDIVRTSQVDLVSSTSACPGWTASRCSSASRRSTSRPSSFS